MSVSKQNPNIFRMKAELYREPREWIELLEIFIALDQNRRDALLQAAHALLRGAP